jgi:hypothetical protein
VYKLYDRVKVINKDSFFYNEVGLVINIDDRELFPFIVLIDKDRRHAFSGEELEILIDDISIEELDNINKPKHYNNHPSGIECIEIAKHHDFCIGNAIKYLWRAGLKDGNSEIQDLKKAIWYIQCKIDTLIVESEAKNEN